MNGRQWQADFRLQIPPVRKAHRARSEHEGTFSFDEERKIFLNESASREQGMFVMIRHIERCPTNEVDQFVPTPFESSRPTPDEMAAQRFEHLSPFCSGSLHCSVHGAGVEFHQLLLAGNVAVVPIIEFDPLGEIERTQTESPPERTLGVWLIITSLDFVLCR
jgi:hypothetical protein